MIALAIVNLKTSAPDLFNALLTRPEELAAGACQVATSDKLGGRALDTTY